MKAKKFLSILLTLAITLSLLPAITIPVHAARVLNFVVNGRTYENLSPGSFSTMFFGGYEWYALDKMPDSDQWLIDELYLVAKTDVFGTTAYRQLIKNPTGDYYDNLNSSNPNDYSGSTLQGKMDWIKNSMPAHDRNMLINRSLDKINGPAVTAGVWPLSEDETRLLGYYSQFPRDYWLRTGYSQTWLSSTSALVQRADGGKISTSLLGGDYWTVDKERAIRPACYIDTRNMFFAFPESSLVRARPFLSYELTALEKNQIKLRAYNSSLDISLYPTDLQMTGTNGLFTFDYRNASTGADRHISCILTDMNDNVMGYCKLKYVGTPVDESGVVTIEIPYQAIGAGQYKLKIFTEQSYQYGTNLCSRPVEITFNCAADGNLAVQSAPKSAPLLKLESATVESDGSVTVSFYGNKGGFDSYYYYTVAPHWYEAYDIVMEELVITPLLVAINSSDPNAHEIMNDGTNTIHVGPIPQGYNLYILAANYANRSNLLSVDVNPRVGVFEILDWDVLAAIQTNIDNLLGYFNQPGDVIQIKGAGWDRQPPPPSLPHALTPLYINIPQGVTVEWYAESIGETDGIWDIGMVEISGSGTFKMMDGFLIKTGEFETVGHRITTDSFGGWTQVYGNGFTIKKNHMDYPNLEIAGGAVVNMTNSPAINAPAAISGGCVFAATNGAGASAQVALNSYLYGNGILVAWNVNSGNTTYMGGTAADLNVTPAGCAVWDRDNRLGSGIRYSRGDNTGFFPVPGVDVIVSTVSETVDITGKPVAQIKNEIESAVYYYGTVTVTGSASGVTQPLAFAIPDAVTVKWGADYSGTVSEANSGLIVLAGGGTFEVTGGVIENNGSACTIRKDTGVPYGRTAISVTGGAVKANGFAAKAIYSYGDINVSGGLVYASSGAAIELRDNGMDTSVYVSGGEVDGGTSGSAIYAPGHNVYISGGLVHSSLFSYAVYYGNLIATGGFIFGIGGSGSFINSAYLSEENEQVYTCAKGDAVIAAWNIGTITWPTTNFKYDYIEGTSTRLIVIPSGSAVWHYDVQLGSGIAYSNGSNTGFFPIPDVTITSGVSYNVTVTADMEALGAGRYEPGATVEIDAGLTSGQRTFVQWLSDPVITITGENNPRASFVMPAYDVDLTALYDQITLPPEIAYPTDIINIPDEIMAGTPFELTATVMPRNSIYQEDSIIWAVVDDDGTGAVIVGNTFTAENRGTATISATIVEPGNPGNIYCTREASIFVYPAPVTGPAPLMLPTPTLADRTADSLTITAVTADPGQEVEYAINTKNAFPDSGWQSGLTFDGLDEYTLYYIYARTVAPDEATSLPLTAYTKDVTAPTATIQYRFNGPEAFSNETDFARFYKNNMILMVQAADYGSGVATIEYYLTETAVADAEDITGWTTVTGVMAAFGIAQYGKYILYVRVTDNDSNSVFYSDSLVIYKDAELITGGTTFIKGSASGQTAYVYLNGNTIAKINDGFKDLVPGTDYTISAEAADGTTTITFEAGYLDSLIAGDYKLTIGYNPLGMEFPEEPLPGTDPTTDTKISLEVSDIPSYTFTVTAGTGGTVSGTVGGSYTADTSISVTAAAKSGYHFVDWTASGITLTDNTNSAAAFSMPSGAVTLTANFALNAPTVTSVTVSPSAADVQQGTTQLFAAAVAGTNNPDATVIWSVSGNAETGTYISFDGLLTVDLAELEGTILTVTAASAVDATKSGSATVTVTDTPPAPTYSVSLSESGTYTFTEETYGYGAQAARTVTVCNTGNQATGALTVALSGTDEGCFALSNASITDITENGSDSFTVIPGFGLSAGTYNATVTVSGAIGISESFDVSFTVDKAGQTLSAANITRTAGDDEIDLYAHAKSTAGAGSGEITYAVTTAGAGASIAGTTLSYTLAGTAIITATAEGSENYNSAFTTFTLKVSAAPPTVTSVTVSPSTTNVEQGTVRQFTASVTGTNDPAATVTWSVSGGTGSTDIDASGLLTIDAAQADGSTLTVTATSTIDTSISGSATVTVIIPQIIPVYGLSLSETGTYTFTAATYGYGAQAARTITVSNTGNQATGALTIALSGINAGSFTLSDTSVTGIVENGSDSFTVVPKTGLGAGTYTATITVSGGNGISESFNVSFTVTTAMPTNPPASPPSTPPGEGGRTTDLGGGKTVGTPPGQDPIENDDGGVTLPGGGTITTPGAGAPPPSEEGGSQGGGAMINVPPGTVIDGGGKISFPQGSGGGTITDKFGNTFNVPEDAVIILDMDTPLGYYITVDNLFRDVKDNDWYNEAVLFAYSHGLMNGTSTDPMMFSPGATATRGMMVAILYRMAGSPDVSSLENPFDDVAGGTWYADAVKWAAANSIVGGIGGGLYDPNAPITRQDMAVILARYADFMGIALLGARDYTGFIDDADIADYAVDAIERFSSAAIIGGYPDGSFKPQATATRAEVASMMMRFLEAME